MSKRYVNCLITSLFLSLLLVGIFSEKGIQSVNCSEKETHFFENEETIVEVSSNSQILQSSSLDEIQFNTKYQHSRFVTNPYNEPLLLNFSEGIMGCPSDYSEIKLFDSLGNNINPIIKNDTAINPSFSVVLPPFHTYNLSISANPNWPVAFSFEKNIFGLIIGLQQYFIPSNITVIFPHNYTIIEYSENGQYYFNDYENISIKWCFEENQTNDSIIITFVPFNVEIITKEVTYTLEFPTIKSANSLISSSYNEKFVTQSKISIWDIVPYFYRAIPFPNYSENVTVKNVYDGVDQCKNVQEQIVNLENDSLGQYYIDYENNVLIIYPRHHSKNEFYEYEIGATFEIPNPSSEKSVWKIIKDFFIPYECKFVGNLTDVPRPSHLKQDVTGNFQLKFVLPTGLEIIPEESGYPSISTDENGHPIACYTKNSPITIHAEEKVVLAHIKSWRDFLVIEIVSVCGMAAFYFYAKNKEVSKKWNIGFTTIAGPAFMLNIAQFVAIGLPGIPIFIILLIIELVLLLLIIKNATSNEMQKSSFSIKIIKQWIKF